MLQRVKAKEKAAASQEDNPQPVEETRSEGRSVGRTVGKKQRREASESSRETKKRKCDQKSPTLPAWPNGRVPPLGVTGVQLGRVRITTKSADPCATTESGLEQMQNSSI